MRKNFANFTSTLTTTSMTSGSTSFTVTAGQGSFYPLNNFYLTVESEIMLISGRTGDTFTISARGVDGTTATSHAIGVTVQQAVISKMFTDLWANVADTFTPQVPPYHLGGTASIYDHEFDSPLLGGEPGSAWVTYPSAGAGTTFSIGSTLASHLLLNRGSNDNVTYTAYVPYSATSAATFTLKMSEASSLLRTSGDQAQVSFFVSDQSNPTAGPDTGNRFKVNTVLQSVLSGGVVSQARLVRGVVDTSGSFSAVGTTLAVGPSSPLYLRITYDGSGTYTGYAGDGSVYWTLAQRSGLSFAPQSLGVAFHIFNPSGQWVPQTVAVDFVRVGSQAGPYG